ncbi:SPOSA6832_00242 [Sporobolomyces salmonicolor]|uniref:RING-type E3 ubiquitin transferase (cysteine targeting) n=1 Tax=Sporidiobolus salmonicolor TaxID=5005 RepID=A0A0D6EFX0_SPOSA|nr:SPOSA6832_00242 [Sporobolomyces salmonicolor]
MANPPAPAGPSVSTPADLERFWHPPPPSLAALPAIRNSLVRFPSAPLRISRVAQLDASLLDNELEAILQAPVKTALAGVTTPGRWSWEPEVLALLRLAMLRMSLWDNGATYGSSLQNLRYRNEGKHGRGLQSTATDSSLTRLQKLAYTALFVLPPYLQARVQDRMLTSSWADEPLPRTWISLIDPRRGLISGRRRGEEMIQWRREWKRAIWELLGAGEKLAAFAELANFFIFLYNGRYRTLVHRILKMRLVYAQRSVTPNVSFEYLNRQLVWEAFTEFLLFLMPLINLHRLRLRLSKAVTSRAVSSKTLRAVASALPVPLASTLGLSSLAASSNASSDPSETRKGPLHFLPPTTCPICCSSLHQLPATLPSSSLADPTTPSSSLLHSASTSSGPIASQDTTVKIPYVADCTDECRYCYYCIVGALARAEEEAEEAWKCLRCGGEVRGVRREEVGEREAEEEEEKRIDDKEEEETADETDHEAGSYPERSGLLSK